MLFADIDAYTAGRTLGRALAVLLSIGGLLKCVSISRRPATNAKCVWALALLMILWLVSGLRTFIPSGTPTALAIVLTALSGLSILGLMIASIVLGIWGLVEYDHERFVQGRAQAIWALGLNGLMLLIFVIAMAVTVSKTMAKKEPQPAYGELLTFKDLNFQFSFPGSPWVKWDPSRLNGGAKVAFIRSNPEMYLMITVESAGNLDYSTESLVELSAARLKSASESAKVIQKGPARVSDLNGVEVLTEARVNDLPIVYVQWFCATNGWLYRITSWGSANEQGRVLAEARWVRERFRPIDYARRPVLKGSAPAEDFVSTNFGYRVRCAGSDWNQWANLDADCQFASFGILRRNAALAVSAVSLADLPQEPDAIYRGLFGLLMTTDVLKQAHPVQEGQLEGVEASLTRPSTTGKEFAYRLKVLHNEDFAYFITAWVSKEDPDAEKDLNDAMSRVEFMEKPKAAPDLAVLSQRERRGERMALNGIGMIYFNEQRYDQSAGFFKRAVYLDGLQTNTVYLQNLTEAYIRGGAYRAALDELEQHPAYVDSRTALVASRAFLQGQLGQLDKGIAGYAKLFAGGYRSEEYFKDYIVLLTKAQQQEKAVSEVDAYLKREDSVELRLLQAQLLVQQKKFDRAITLLQALHKNNPFHAGITYSLGDAMIQSGKPSDALTLSGEMLKQAGPSVATWMLKGRAQFALKWYREAKESFESLTKIAPENREARQFLEAISGMVGEGSSIAVRDPISPVPLPAELAAPPSEAASDFGKGEGAFYSQKITAVSFQKGKELKTTEILKAHILSAAGVSAFSTFQIPFNPLNEEMYVNQLVVKDGAGNLVSTGHVADYYVLDDRSSDSANNHKVLNIPVAGLEPGYSVELTLTHRDLGNPDEFAFLPCVFSTSFPIQERILYYAGDTNLIRFASSPSLDSHPVSGGVFWREASPPLIRWEPLLPPVADYLHMVWVSDASARWPNLVTNYLESIRDRLELPADQKELARQIVLHATNLTQKIDAVASYVQTNYTYRAIEFGRRARVPQSISDMVRNKSGDCKDHAVLVQQLLKSVGVPANLALLNLGSTVRTDLPSLDQFNHMVVYVPSAENKFLDCTAKGFDLSASAFGLEKKEALILDEKQSRFEKIPDYPTNVTVITIERSVGLTNQTDAHVRETVTFRGLYAGFYRQYIRNLPSSNRRTFLANQFFGISAEVEDFKIRGLEEESAPLVLEFVYLARNQFHAVENELVGNSPMNFERGLLLDQAVETRTAPFEIPIPLTVECSMDVHTPDGFKPQPVSNIPLDIGGPFISAHFSATTNDAGWRMNYRFGELSGRFAAGEYPAHNLAMRQTLDMLAPHLVCVRNSK